MIKTDKERQNRSDPNWLRDQLDSLADDCTGGHPTGDALVRLLKGIARGYDWRLGAWR